jgi:hypothetical protein
MAGPAFDDAAAVTGRYLAETAFTMAARVIGKHVRRGARLLD